ncbi:MAG: hypothetical protein GTN82_02705 [Candidatus Aminicenantes bacterium]|nr:hypothetical protein [Candidatus Aminicenantes bacterium]
MRQNKRISALSTDQKNYLEGVIDDLVEFSNAKFEFFQNRKNHEMAMGFVRERAGTIRKILAKNRILHRQPWGHLDAWDREILQEYKEPEVKSNATKM